VPGNYDPDLDGDGENEMDVDASDSIEEGPVHLSLRAHGHVCLSKLGRRVCVALLGFSFCIGPVPTCAKACAQHTDMHLTHIHSGPTPAILYVDADLADLAEGVNALSVAVEEPVATQFSSEGSPGTRNGARNDAQEVQPDSPDYNDVNFWKPSINWFDGK
jgi:hypothetical protein